MGESLQAGCSKRDSAATKPKLHLRRQSRRKSAARSQYQMAKEGAQKQDKESSQAMVDAAAGGVMEVQALLQDQYLTAPYDGEIDVIYPHESELVSLGTPIMSLL